MKILSFADCSAVSGGLNEAMITAGLVGIMGGALTTSISSFFSPVSTFVSTLGGGLGGAVVCTTFAPGVGTVICGTGGGRCRLFLRSNIDQRQCFYLRGRDFWFWCIPIYDLTFFWDRMGWSTGHSRCSSQSVTVA